VLFIETYVREDQLIRLFGFESRAGAGMVPAAAERSGRRRQGGAGGAVDADGVGDSPMRSRCRTRRWWRARPVIGPKVAQRIVAKLKNKAPALGGEAGGAIGLKQELGEGAASAPVADAVSALSNLGYSRDQAANAVAAAMKEAGEGADSAKLIRLGLKELAR
jgi:Holliday junction DNA helicase RuvA